MFILDLEISSLTKQSQLEIHRLPFARAFNHMTWSSSAQLEEKKNVKNIIFSCAMFDTSGL